MRHALLALALLAAGCGSDAPDRPAVELVQPDGSAKWGFTPEKGGVLTLGTLPVSVHEPVTFTDVRLEVTEGDIELLGVRLLPGDYATSPGSACSRTAWPPRGFPGTSPLDTPVEARTRPTFVLYFRARTPDAAVAPAMVITYRDAKGKQHQLRKANEEISIDAAGSKGGGGCPGSPYLDPA